MAEPNAFLLGCLFNYQWPYVKAMSAPLELRRRLLEVALLSKMPWDELAPFIVNGEHGTSLHRYPNNLAKREGTPATEVVARLQDFHGISQKISNMMALLLVRDFGVHLTKWEEIDIAVDRHVARLFLRTGLVQRDVGSYSVGEIAEEVVVAARIALPLFPGHLDGSCFQIGLEWCTEEEAFCDWADAPCPLRKNCRRKTDMHIQG